MSKEVIIVFVYDKEKCQDEADDPISAVAYFHPTWVSDTQKLTLCGQLMGVSHFLELNFNSPRIICLENGKFVIKDFGRFLLAIGTDRNVSDSILEHRAKLLTSLVKLFHRDLENIYDQCMSISGQYRNFCTKLYYIMETYISAIQYNGNIFQNVPTLKLPTSASNIFLDAIQTLQCCQQTKGVLGGAILYENKIIATQLSPMISKHIVLTDPYRMKSTAEGITVRFHVPVGVQLIGLYISHNEYLRLQQDASRAQTSFTQITNSTIYPPQIKRKIKRDKSLIFSNIPEEDVTNTEEPKPKPIKSRPTHLPLRFKNVTSKEIPESGVNSITFDDTDSFPQFIGKTSICSTPIAENKILVGNVMPICANRNAVIPENTEEGQTNDQKSDIKFGHTMIRPQTKFKKFKRRFSFRPLKRSLTQLGLSLINDKNINTGYRCQTITDPNYPVFNDDGLPISKYLYDSCVSSEDVENITDTADDVLINSNIQSFSNEPIPKDEISENKTEACPDKNVSNNIINSIATDANVDVTEKRKSLTLPLKPLNTNVSNITDSPIKQKTKLSGIPLTPLMSKLSILAANDERSSGFSSWDTTPGQIEGSIMTPIDINKTIFRRRSSAARTEDTDCSDEIDSASQKVELFICGHQNMTMVLLMEENSAQKHEIVHAMWEICISRLTKIENSLHKILNVNVDGLVDKSDANYSFIYFDPKWDIIHRGGPWTAEELLILEDMHTDFKINPSFTETIIRCEDAIVYGYQCGDTQIFYKQPVHSHKGLPPPADAMGNVSLIAKRRLERDHSIILL
uniref:CCZ1/INTU/HSP4 first Longin domain-containing protein n=1 Tax=Phlebotomus kandelakii TaxID=1109342 RepID=A0A6B2E9N5_9DIPT